MNVNKSGVSRTKSLKYIKIKLQLELNFKWNILYNKRVNTDKLNPGHWFQNICIQLDFVINKSVTTYLYKTLDRERHSFYKFMTFINLTPQQLPFNFIIIYTSYLIFGDIIVRQCKSEAFLLLIIRMIQVVACK